MAAVLRNDREAIPVGPNLTPVEVDCKDRCSPINHHATLIEEQTGGATTRVQAGPLGGDSTMESGRPSELTLTEGFPRRRGGRPLRRS